MLAWIKIINGFYSCTKHWSNNAFKYKLSINEEIAKSLSYNTSILDRQKKLEITGLQFFMGSFCKLLIWFQLKEQFLDHHLRKATKYKEKQHKKENYVTIYKRSLILKNTIQDRKIIYSGKRIILGLANLISFKIQFQYLMTMVKKVFLWSNKIS